MTGENTLLLNIVHFLESVPACAAPGADCSIGEDPGRKALNAESLEAFQKQLMLTRKTGLRTTVLMNCDALFSAEAARLAREYYEHGCGEIGLSFFGFSCEEGRKNQQAGVSCDRVNAAEDRKSAVRDAFEKFRDVFGFCPESIGLCRMDEELIRFIKAEYPSVKCVAAVGREERAEARDLRDCSGSLFRDGGPWAPWIPSGANACAPAANEQEDSGVVAIPLLNKGVSACFDGSGGIACDILSMSPCRMNRTGGAEQNAGCFFESWEEVCASCGTRKFEGRLTDLTMSEFADVYRAQKSYTTPECAFLREDPDGSEMRRFWYCDPYFRACVDLDRGGAVVDLRPYISKPEQPAGAGAPSVRHAVYPFLIQEQDREGACESTVRSAKICRNGEEADLCLFRTEAVFSREGEDRTLTLDPVEIVFRDGLSVKLQTVITFSEGSASIRVDRTLLSISDPEAEVVVKEYITACCGAAEAPGDLTSLSLHIEAGEEESVTLSCADQGREAAVADAEEVSCSIPPMKTRVSMLANGRRRTGFVREGDADSPVFTLGWERRLRQQEVFTTWLNLEREG